MICIRFKKAKKVAPREDDSPEEKVRDVKPELLLTKVRFDDSDTGTQEPCLRVAITYGGKLRGSIIVNRDNFDAVLAELDSEEFLEAPLDVAGHR